MPLAEKQVSGTIVWFRRDLRIHDQPALVAASQRGGPVACVYVLGFDEDKHARAQRAWMVRARKALHRSLSERYGSCLWCCRPDGEGEEYVAKALQECLKATGSTHLYYSRRYEPDASAEDEKIAGFLREAGMNVRGYPGHLLCEPAEVGKWMEEGKRRGGAHFGTLLPMLHAVKQVGVSDEVVGPPRQLKNLEQQQCNDLAKICFGTAENAEEEDKLTTLWAGPMAEFWDISEEGGQQVMNRFVEMKLHDYESKRSRADLQSVSCLSPYLASGMLSPRFLFVASHARGTTREKPISKTFTRRLVWRDLAYWQMYRFPHLSSQPLRTHHAAYPWDKDPRHLHAWQKGLTGYPIIDAGMRQLWKTGWMPQNIRMATASFLVEYMNHSWMDGLTWYRDTLIDHDLAINSMMWQNAGRSGLDQWNFVIHPVTSPKTSDPTGEYVRRWVPELSKLPTKWIHQPWAAPNEILLAAGVELGIDYPHRIIEDLEGARASSLQHHLNMQCHADKKYHTRNGYDVIWPRSVAQPGDVHSKKGSKILQDTMQFVHVFTRKEFRCPGVVDETRRLPSAPVSKSETSKPSGKKRAKVSRLSNQTLLNQYYRSMDNEED